MNRSTNPYKRHRFPPAIIRCAVWLYHHFNLSHRDIEDLLAERETEASYESVRLGCNKFGPLSEKPTTRQHALRNWLLLARGRGHALTKATIPAT